MCRNNHGLAVYLRTSNSRIQIGPRFSGAGGSFDHEMLGIVQGSYDVRCHFDLGRPLSICLRICFRQWSRALKECIYLVNAGIGAWTPNGRPSKGNCASDL
ncbi:hypothetical protein BH23CHL2_BH23CHL2_34740 [soil metagenome]